MPSGTLKQTVAMLGALWGVGGIVLLFLSACWRLGRLALEAFSGNWAWYHWPTLALVIVFMAHAEGYRGFQQGFSPRAAARARYLREHPRALWLALAPLFCMGYIHATRKRRTLSFSLTLGIVALVLLVRLLPQPWRGIIDAGVVVGLLWGVISLTYFSVRALTSPSFNIPPETPSG